MYVLLLCAKGILWSILWNRVNHLNNIAQSITDKGGVPYETRTGGSVWRLETRLSTMGSSWVMIWVCEFQWSILWSKQIIFGNTELAIVVNDWWADWLCCNSTHIFLKLFSLAYLLFVFAVRCSCSNVPKNIWTSGGKSVSLWTFVNYDSIMNFSLFFLFKHVHWYNFSLF